MHLTSPLVVVLGAALPLVFGFSSASTLAPRRGATLTKPDDGDGGCIVIATAGVGHLPEGPQNNITVTLNLPKSHTGGQAAFWSNITQGIQWRSGVAWPTDGKAYIESDALEYGFEAQVISAGGPSSYGYFLFT